MINWMGFSMQAGMSVWLERNDMYRYLQVVIPYVVIISIKQFNILHMNSNLKIYGALMILKEDQCGATAVNAEFSLRISDAITTSAEI